MKRDIESWYGENSFPAVFVWQSQRSESLSDLALANIEALASGESVEMQVVRELLKSEIATMKKQMNGDVYI